MRSIRRLIKLVSMKNNATPEKRRRSKKIIDQIHLIAGLEPAVADRPHLSESSKKRFFLLRSYIFLALSLFFYALSIMGALLIPPDSVRRFLGMNIDAFALPLPFFMIFGIAGSLGAGFALIDGIIRKAGNVCAGILEERNAALDEIEAWKTDCNASKKAKRRNESLMTSILEHSKDMVLLLEPDSRIRFAGGDLSLSGLSQAELAGKEFFKLLANDDGELLHSAFLHSLNAGEPAFTMSFSLKRADSKDIHVDMHVSNQIANEDISGVLVNVKDVSREKHAEERAEFYAHFDPLTRLLNKDGFMIAVERAINVAENRNRIFSVMAIGVDRFIRVNDLYGTAVGDKLLTEIASRLRSAFRDDDVIARYRGDKFFVLFPEIRLQENINDILDKARSVFTAPFAVDGLSVALTASFGLSVYPNDGKDGPEIVRNAETALYMAKESGRDAYRLYDPKLNGRILEHQKIEADLGIAIRLNQFEPFFQPKVNRDGYIVGAEALVRWRLPSGEIKPPGYFIDVAEKSGSIDKIGALMLNMTCDSVASWKKRGLANVPVSVNLSTRQFSQDSLVGDIEDALRLAKVHPSLIELEITESGIMENEKEGIKKLLELKKMGVSVSIDDFGTGYSSFSKLKDYPIDTVKMDKSFVDPLPNDRRASIIASAIVDLAHTLSFSVVAEGVEKYEQLRFLDTIFCDSFQGYLFSKPVPEAEYATLLANSRPLQVK